MPVNVGPISVLLLSFLKWLCPAFSPNAVFELLALMLESAQAAYRSVTAAINVFEERMITVSGVKAEERFDMDALTPVAV